jgi:hypothetical protein
VFKDDSLTNNLAGLSNLTNMGCKVILDAETISVIRDGEIIWSGTKGTRDKLWNLDLADLHSTPESPPNVRVNQDDSFGREHMCNMVLPGQNQTDPLTPSGVNSTTPPTCVAFQTIRHDTVAEFAMTPLLNSWLMHMQVLPVAPSPHSCMLRELVGLVITLD